MSYFNENKEFLLFSTRRGFHCAVFCHLYVLRRRSIRCTESHKIQTLLSETGSCSFLVSKAKSTRHLKKAERQAILFSTAMPLRSHGMSLKTVPLRSTPLTRVISSRSAIPRITNFFSRGSLSIVKTSIFLPDAILSLLPSP